MVDVKLNGTELIPILSGGLCSEPDGFTASFDKDFSYIITDSQEGIDFAFDNSIGYVFLENDEPANTVNAQCIIQGLMEVDYDFIHKMYQRRHNIPWTILSTKRLTLREMTVNDVDRMYEIYAGEGIADYIEPLFADRMEEIEYTKDYIKNVYEFCGYGLWLVVENSTGRVVGRAGIVNREGYDDAELAYVIERDRQRMHYALEVCQAIIDYAREYLCMKALNCFVQVDNTASVSLCERLGFEYMEEVYVLKRRTGRYRIEL